MHDREKTGSLEIVPVDLGVVRKQKVDIPMNIGRPSFRSHASIDFAGGEEVELGSALRTTLQPEPVRRLPVAYAAHSFGKPGHGFLVETVLVFEQAPCPDRCRRQPVLYPDAFAV